MTEKITEEQVQLVYDLMNGMIDLDNFPCKQAQIVKNEFEAGTECDRLYGEVYNACLRINDRLHVIDDDDVNIILSSMSDITEILCKKMFQYGVDYEKLL